MSFKFEPGRFSHLQDVLTIACLSLAVVFIGKLYKARLRVVKLKSNGLVRTFFFPEFLELL